MAGVLEYEFTLSVGEILGLLFLGLACVVFVGAGIAALVSVWKALRNHPFGFLRYTKAVGPRFAAIAIGTVLFAVATDSSVSWGAASAISFGMYGWMFFLFASLEAPDYT